MFATESKRVPNKRALGWLVSSRTRHSSSKQTKRTNSRDILTAMDPNPHSVCWIGRNSSFRDELKRTCFDEVCIRIDGPRRTGVGESG
jgi:hypothetical protein